MGTKHRDPVRDRVGVYYKYEYRDYRSECKSCGRGYHKHRWQAHHVLPGMVFGGLDGFINECLGVTDYNINKPYSMGGLPTLKAFIHYFQNDPDFPIQKNKEKLIQMRRWGKIRTYKSQAHMTITFPGNYPCHNPVSFGHNIYNEDVKKYLNTNVWNPLKKSKKKNKHFKPKDVKQKLINAQKKFWKSLENRGKGPGGGNNKGIKSNMKNRYGSAKNGWWKPLCMAEVNSAPVSPSLV